MIVLGLDPGATTGWCVYDSQARIATASGRSCDVAVLAEAEHHIAAADAIVIERPKGYGFNTRPQMVDCGYVCGYIVSALNQTGRDVLELTRLEICQALQSELHGVIRVRNDATAWAALLEMHGGAAAAKKGGTLYGVKSHGRAALAAAVAWTLRLRAGVA